VPGYFVDAALGSQSRDSKMVEYVHMRGFSRSFFIRSNSLPVLLKIERKGVGSNA